MKKKKIVKKIPENELEDDNIMRMMVGAIKIMENEIMKNMQKKINIIIL